MKAYAIVENGCEYNDEYYYETEGYEFSGRAFASEEKANTECDAMNGRRMRDGKVYSDEEGHAITPFKVVEIEIED